ncbi:hypothetical protein [Clavibacter lycopersici]|uniref:hypothetical protein n=1 Tax=Clavibacter lycopersici TaxID=2301718 RepID=UPI001314357B|nr:hypothetical protein [Clavibacter lycopersici]
MYDRKLISSTTGGSAQAQGDTAVARLTGQAVARGGSQPASVDATGTGTTSTAH